jgi:hypothetical protein
MRIKSLVLGLAVAVSLGSTAEAGSLVSMVLNGSLETSGTGDGFNLSQNSGQNSTIPNWSVHGNGTIPGFNAVYDYGVVGSSSLPAYMPSSYNSCILGFVGGNSCSNPDGTGHFVNLDGDPSFPAAISQSISGLVSGQQYRLTFSWAAVQRNDQNSPTYGEFLDVSLGDQHFMTPVVGINLPGQMFPAQGFSGWFTTSFVFNWDGVDNTLNFLAHGNPSGLPPSINLDGILLNATPEPASWEMFIAGFGLMGVFFARRRRKTAVD